MSEPESSEGHQWLGVGLIYGQQVLGNFTGYAQQAGSR